MISVEGMWSSHPLRRCQPTGDGAAWWTPPLGSSLSQDYFSFRFVGELRAAE